LVIREEIKCNLLKESGRPAHIFTVAGASCSKSPLGRAMRPRSAESSREIFTAEKIEDSRLWIVEKTSSFSDLILKISSLQLLTSMFDVPFTPQSPITNNSSPSSFQLFRISAFQLLPHTPH
jgi:hypothetical protein